MTDPHGGQFQGAPSHSGAGRPLNTGVQELATDHFMPLFVGDFLASTATWSGPERGLYLQLLMLQWGAKRLPNDLLKLSRAVGYTKSEFDDLWPVMAEKFEEADGFLLNPRLEEIRARNAEIAEARRLAGQRGADARWHGKGNAVANGKGNGKIMPSEPNRTVTEENPKKETTARSEPAEFAILWSKYPPRAGANPKGRALRAANARLSEGTTWAEMIAGVERYAEYIRQTGKANTEYVRQAATFLGPDKSYLDRWAIPASKAQAAQDQNIVTSLKWLQKGSHA